MEGVNKITSAKCLDYIHTFKREKITESLISPLSINTIFSFSCCQDKRLIHSSFPYLF